MNNLTRTISTLALLGTLMLGAGCQPADQPEMHTGRPDSGSTSASSSPESAVTGLPSVGSAAPAGSATPEGGTPAGMMTEDPMSIREVEGKVAGVDGSDLMVEMVGKGVTLKFHLTPQTVIKPAGKKLAADQNVKIEIQHVPDGMAAKEIDIK